MNAAFLHAYRLPNRRIPLLAKLGKLFDILPATR
jgi:hypothetical protein